MKPAHHFALDKTKNLFCSKVQLFFPWVHPQRGMCNAKLTLYKWTRSLSTIYHDQLLKPLSWLKLSQLSVGTQFTWRLIESSFFIAWPQTRGTAPQTNSTPIISLAVCAPPARAAIRVNVF